MQQYKTKRQLIWEEEFSLVFKHSKKPWNVLLISTLGAVHKLCRLKGEGRSKIANFT